jgi:hypothetical protein
MFCWSLFVLMYFFFWPLCCSSIYGFWLPPFGVFLWVNCKWFLYCQNKLNIYFKKNYPWDKIWTNLHINRATQEKQTSSVGKLYTIQFIQKQNWKNRIYERFMSFFLYTRVETWKHLFYDCTVVQQNHIGVKKLQVLR